MYRYVVTLKLTSGCFDHRTYTVTIIAKDDEKASESIKVYLEGKEKEGWKLVESNLKEKEYVQ